jgi:transposase
LATGRWADKTLYRPRDRIELFFNEFKRFRRIATQYGRAARNYLVSAKQHEFWRWI